MTATTRRGSATLLEVARDAGVSKTSVSRYFGDERSRLSTAMQQRIAASAERLGYRPNRIARGLKGGQSGLIGMLVADIRNPFSVAVMHGVEQACRAHGFSLMVCNTDNDADQAREHLALLASYRVEGLVLNVAGHPGEALAALAERNAPLVLLDRALDDLAADMVGLDNDQAIDAALDHLRRQGYGELLYVSEPPERASSRQQRLERFRERLDADGLQGETCCLALDDAPALERAIAGFLDRPSHAPKAVLCANGNVTLAVTRVLQARGDTLGTTGLMGIDELDWCGMVGPGITTLAQPTEAIGRAAMDSLLERQADARRPPRQVRFSPTLIPRGSTRR
ncbi:LacI family DNA-binding transcriptional regulator [Halomonas getboli]|uniref:LacI family DNA-binding transcriptional regulator n=1 Tax=Halomonas getboli TaxID=2935862 RepID=UPI0020003E8F|nr:LacI family DNA-binding transcriptional regulator [Halomonas getboli]MCK2185258.1 LacI family DNA-binding transcriptional regulator [Halomonas getboli]